MTTEEITPPPPTGSTARRTSVTEMEEIIHYPEKITCWFTIHPPKQRQRWNDTQVLPHVNWGDLFFDLFYVAAAYNLSGIITANKDRHGILYFLGCFGPIMSVWLQKMYFDSRFALDDDPFHRLFEVIMLCFLGTCVLHITTVEDLSHPSNHADMFAFSLGLSLIQVGVMGRYAEVYFRGVGEHAAKLSSVRDIVQQAIPGIFYFAAAIYSGVQFYNGADTVAYEGDTAHNRFRFLAGGYTPSNSSSYKDEEDDVTHIPIILCLVGYLAGQLYLMLYVVVWFPQDGSHKEVSVPMNIDFSIHRYGEWTMLLLGESILSLLIVEVSDSVNYYVTFYAGIVSTILMQYLHFRSQPHHADDHAMRRDKNAGIFYSTMMQVYSVALVLLGVSFKMLLYEYTYSEEDYDTSKRRMLRSTYETVMRYLAGGGDSDYPSMSTEERRQRVAHFFCGSLALAWLSLDLMVLAHLGFDKNKKRCKCKEGLHLNAIFFGLFRVALIVFIATLSQYVNDPEELALIGLAGILMQVITRVVGDMIIPNDASHENYDVYEHPEESERDKWPNMTHPVSKPYASDVDKPAAEEEDESA